MVDAFDDLATAKAPFRVVACIPVFGRVPLIKQTIRRLYRKNDVYKVICAGHLQEDRDACEAAGAVWVQHPNNTLASKWNRAFQEAKQFDPDACLFVGSSDWVSDNWIHQMRPYVEKYDMVGMLGCHLLDIGKEARLCYWPGYINRRAGESIGIGRLLSRRVLDKLQFKPFDDRLNNSLDFSMQMNCSLQTGSIHVVNNENMKSLSISTDLWDNKHKFYHHWGDDNGTPALLPSVRMSNVEEWITDNFPEAHILCESLRASTPKLT